MDEQPVGVDELMARLRSEVARRRHASAGSNSALAATPRVPAATGVLAPLPLPHLPKAQFSQAARYHLNDFLALHDQEFIDAAYRGVLQREPDPSGQQHFLAGLRDGALSKIEILGRLRFSSEGRQLKVPVKGLLTAFAVQHSYRLPIVGGLLAWAGSILRLPRLARSMQSLESYQHMRNAELEGAIGDLAHAASGHERVLVAKIERVGGAAREGVRTVGNSLENLRKREGDLQKALEALRGRHTEVLTSLQALRQEHTALAGSHAAAQSRIAALDEQQQENATALDNWRQRSAMAAAEATQRLAAIESKAQSLEQDAARTKLQQQTLEQRLTQAESGQQALDQRIGAAEQARTLAEQTRTLAEQARAEAKQAEQRLQALLSQSQQAASQQAANLQNALNAIEQRVRNLGQTVQGQGNDLRTDASRIAARVARVEGRVHEQSQRLSVLPPGAPATVPSAKGKKTPVALAPAVAARFDSMYFAFEERFRGTREDIRQRVAYYLPILRQSVVGKKGASVLDVGCGRGEWLELLRDEKINARGVDINEQMAQECVERGLDVKVEDAIAYLRKLPDNALGAVTGFHIIEHVPLDTLLELFEQAQRVVQPGGVVIFETPNPENVIVGACNFYMDPTHQRPLPPALTQFLLEASGFAGVEVHRVNADLLPEPFEEPADSDSPALRAALTFLRSAFSCAPDYSVVGRVA